MNDSDSFFGSGRKISFLKRKTEDGSAILLGKLQDLLECLFFSRIDGIDQRAAGIYLKGSFYDDRIRAVDGERDGAEHGKLGYGSFHGGGLVDSGDTHIYIKNVSAGGHFSKPFLFNGDEASLLNIFPECLSSCRIDSFANLDGSVIITDIDDACAAGKCSKGLYLWRRDSWFVFKFLD